MELHSDDTTGHTASGAAPMTNSRGQQPSRSRRDIHAKIQLHNLLFQRTRTNRRCLSPRHASAAVCRSRNHAPAPAIDAARYGFLRLSCRRIGPPGTHGSVPDRRLPRAACRTLLAHPLCDDPHHPAFRSARISVDEPASGKETRRCARLRCRPSASRGKSRERHIAGAAHKRYQQAITDITSCLGSRRVPKPPAPELTVHPVRAANRQQSAWVVTLANLGIEIHS